MEPITRTRRTGGPRAGGGSPAMGWTYVTGTTGSPRRRGWAGVAGHVCLRVSVVPVQAGVARCTATGVCRVRGGPRAGGGGPGSDYVVGQVWAWSPSRRGWSEVVVRAQRAADVVPAQAEVVRACTCSNPPRTRGPRAGGGGPFVGGAAVAVFEWSPRRRGSSASARGAGVGGHMIPAQAGAVRHSRRPYVALLGGPRAGGGWTSEAAT